LIIYLLWTSCQLLGFVATSVIFIFSARSRSRPDSRPYIIDPKFVEKHSVLSSEISPIVLRLLDGSVGAVITHAADIRIYFSTNDILTLRFYVTPLDSTTVLVFGYNWLHHYNPSIDWFAGQLLHFRRLPLSVPSSTRAGEHGSCEPPATKPSYASIPSPATSSVPLGTTFSSSETSSEKISSSENLFFSKTRFPSVSFINATAYARCARLPGSTVFTVTLHPSDPTTGFSAKTEPADLSGIPEEYHEFPDVFSEEQAETLLQHRPYDLKIELEDGAQPPIGRMYPRSPQSQQNF
jgi:hypothetical protein